MQRRLRDRTEWRRRARYARILALCALPFLGGCFPGMGWGDDDAGRASFAGDSQNGPALNRSYKSSFLSLQMPSFGTPRIQGQLMPDTGPALFSAFATVESRKPSQPTTPPGFAANSNERLAFDPALLPAAQALENFYAALAALNAGRRPQPVSIVHLGDDQILDDRFAGSLHDHLIARFGNAGRGLMLPGLYPLHGMKVDRGGQWALATAANGATGPFGITGVRVELGASDAWLRFTTADGAFDWLDVAFMTGPGHGTAAVSVDGDVKLVPTNAAATNETAIRITAKAKEIVIRPKGDGAISVLSVATGTRTPGVLYSNAGLPGAGAWVPEKWNPEFAANDFRKLNPDLILIGYGTREGFVDQLDVKLYETRLRLVIDQIKTWAPQASILIIGPPDAARLPAFAGTAGAQVCRALNPQEIAAYGKMMDQSDERLARWHAPPSLDAVRSTMRRAAAASGAFYWDWAKYMGGPCSIHAWTTFNPPLAAPDHVTLTEAGDDRSARALFAELMAGYDSYQRAVAKAQAAAAMASTASMQPAKVSNKKRHDPQKPPPVLR